MAIFKAMKFHVFRIDCDCLNFYNLIDRKINIKSFEKLTSKQIALFTFELNSGQIVHIFGVWFPSNSSYSPFLDHISTIIKNVWQIFCYLLGKHSLSKD